MELTLWANGGSWRGRSGQAEAALRVEVGDSLRGRQAVSDAKEWMVAPGSRL